MFTVENDSFFSRQKSIFNLKQFVHLKVEKILVSCETIY